MPVTPAALAEDRKVLVQAAIEQAAASARPKDKMMLLVDANNTAAVRLYERCGFHYEIDPFCPERHLMRRPLRLQAVADEDTVDPT